MNGITLRFSFIVFFYLLLTVSLRAQQTRFIYIQAENKEPFYVKLDNRIITSSATGYMIISGLTGEAYRLVIGFTQGKWPDMFVQVNVQRNNAGFLLKSNKQKGWDIFNLQTNDMVIVQKIEAADTETVVKTGGNEFARILAEVVNDPSIAEVTNKKKSVESPIITTGLIMMEKPVVSDSVKTEAPDLYAVDAVVEKYRITRLSRDSTSQGLQLAYIDANSRGTDTIDVFLPVNNKPIESENIQVQVLPVLDSGKTSAANTDPRFINMQLKNPNEKNDSTGIIENDFVLNEKKQVVEKPAKKTTVNTAGITNKLNCKETATQNDFLKLRKQMAAQENEKDMGKVAGKQFIGLCFTTLQVKNLGVLFITEEEKYKFYVAAFPYISDPENYGSLEDQLSDNYFKTRFKAMLSH